VERKMEYYQLIVDALSAGALEACKATSTKAIKDGYAGLKLMVIKYWHKIPNVSPLENENQAKVFLENLERDPDSKNEIYNALVKIKEVPEVELISQSESLLKLIDPKGFTLSKYNVPIKKGQGVQVGDHNIQTNNF